MGAGRVFRATFVNRRKDGTLYPVEVRLQLSRTETPPVFVAIIQHITARKQAEERLSYLAYYGTLTGLPNRALFYESLRQSLVEADRRERLVAVVMRDLDRFKIINDTLGHHVDDGLLKAAAGRLAQAARPGDTVARFGGDEFAVALANVAHVDDVGQVANRILSSFARRCAWRVTNCTSRRASASRSIRWMTATSTTSCATPTSPCSRPKSAARAQRDFLRRHGCDAAQGYYFSRPVGEAVFLALLGNEPWRAPAAKCRRRRAG